VQIQGAIVPRASVGYLNKDYESLRQELLARIPQLTSRWTDLNPSDLGVVLLELFCGIGDMLAYYIDAQAGEAFLPTARQRQSVIDLCKLIGYRFDNPIAASVALQFSLHSPLQQDVFIPAGVVCRARVDDGVVDFETAEDSLIPAGSTEVSIDALQGVRKSQSFQSTGASFQCLRLEGVSIAQGTIRVNVNGDLWREVESFQDSTAQSQHFISDIDALEYTSITFGDGQHGAIVPTGGLIEVEWLQTQGESGNLAPDTITELISTVLLDGESVTLAVTNPLPSTGGAFSESIDHARRQAPLELRSLWKAVTIEDYKALAEGFPGVAKAQVLDTNDCQNIRYYNVHLAIAPLGGGLPSPFLKTQLVQYLETRKVVTVEVRLFDPLYKPVNIDAEVYCLAGESTELVRSRIVGRLKDNFVFEKTSFGQPVFCSDIVSVIDGTRGVSHITLFTPANDLKLRRGEIPTLGQVNLTMRRAVG
jgi:hypothetical protein